MLSVQVGGSPRNTQTLLTLKAISIIKHQITSKISGGQNLTSDQKPIPWGVRNAYIVADAGHHQFGTLCG